MADLYFFFLVRFNWPFVSAFPMSLRKIPPAWMIPRLCTST